MSYILDPSNFKVRLLPSCLEIGMISSCNDHWSTYNFNLFPPPSHVSYSFSAFNSSSPSRRERKLIRTAGSINFALVTLVILPNPRVKASWGRSWTSITRQCGSPRPASYSILSRSRRYGIRPRCSTNIVNLPGHGISAPPCLRLRRQRFALGAERTTMQIGLPVELSQAPCRVCPRGVKFEGVGRGMVSKGWRDPLAKLWTALFCLHCRYGMPELVD